MKTGKVIEFVIAHVVLFEIGNESVYFFYLFFVSRLGQLTR